MVALVKAARAKLAGERAGLSRRVNRAAPESPHGRSPRRLLAMKHSEPHGSIATSSPEPEPTPEMPGKPGRGDPEMPVPHELPGQEVQIPPAKPDIHRPDIPNPPTAPVPKPEMSCRRGPPIRRRAARASRRFLT